MSALRSPALPRWYCENVRRTAGCQAMNDPRVWFPVMVIAVFVAFLLGYISGCQDSG